MPHSIKPNKTSFVTYRFAIFFIISLFIFLLVYLIQIPFSAISFLYFFIIFILVNAIYNYSLKVQFRKEEYLFYPDKIIRKSGGIFSDRETELVVRNITHVIMRLPFIQYKLFQTGNIIIQSAGSSLPEVYMTSLDKPEEMYEYVEKIMKNAGFRLTRSNLVQKEKPSTLGVFFEVFSKVIGGAVAAGYGLAVASAGIWQAVQNLLAVSLIMFVAFFVVFGILIWGFIRFMDLKKRIYSIYSDTITYSEGFLSKNFAFIPIENLADSSTKQTFIDKIFSLYDITISCQGAGQEIHFKNMKKGPALEQTIDKLITKKPEIKKEKRKTGAKKAAHKAAFDTSKTMKFRMDSKRTYAIILLALIPLFIIFILAALGVVITGMYEAAISFVPFLFLLFIGWCISMVTAFIRIQCTRFYVNPTSMSETFNFLTSKRKEFTNEKVTAVIFKENFIDKWFNTCSIHFWSIGSSEDVRFSNIKKTDELYDMILKKFGIKKQEVLYQMNSHFKVIEMLKSTLFLSIFAVLVFLFSIFASVLLHPVFILMITAIIAVYIVIIVYKESYYNRSRMTFYKECMYFQKGIFFKDYFHVLYDNIKDITTIKYPFSKTGLIRFNIAGERVVQQGKNTTIVSNHFAIHYIKNIDVKDELIDLIFFKRPDAKHVAEIEQNIRSYSAKPILVSKPDLANTMLPVILFSVVVFPFIILLPFTIPLTIWYIRVKSFEIEPYRVVAKSGMLYKKQTSIVFSKIDHINFNQGAINKLFKNGSVTINTTGSSFAEIVVINIPDYENFYQTLKEHY